MPPRRRCAFPVQWVNRPDGEFRGFSGTVASGRVAVGDPIVVSGSGRTSSVARIVSFDGDLPSAAAGRSVTLTLADEVDVIRGDVLADSRASAGGRAPLCRRPGVDGRDGRDAGQALSAQDRHGHRARHAQPHRRHARRRIADPRAGDLPGPQRHRPCRDRGGPGRGLRRLCREPADRRLHPDRPVHAAHGGRRHGGRERRHRPPRASPCRDGDAGTCAPRPRGSSRWSCG